VLISSVLSGLSAPPSLPFEGVRGSAEGSFLHEWFVDRAPARPRAPWVLSLPMSIYRGLMLAWTLWLAVRLVRWSRWLRASFVEGGAWRAVGRPAG
jgi:hypothetical protein